MRSPVKDANYSEGQKAEIRRQLRLILESEFFRSSHRGSDFLEYSVEHVLRGRPPEELKERNIGIEIFKRNNSYDTGQDNIVRVTANDVRKRLSRYYKHSGKAGSVLISLPTGSYAASFQWGARARSADSSADNAQPTGADLAAPPGPAPVPNRPAAAPRLPSRSKILLWTALFVVIAAGLLSFRAVSGRPGIVEKVWAPFLKDHHPVLVCIAEPVAYWPPADSKEQIAPLVPIPVSAPQDNVNGVPMVPLSNMFVGVGDAYALADVARVLTAHRAPWRLLAGNETPSQDLKNGPIVLIGVYSNQWTADLTKGLRFGFESGNVIVDHSHPQKRWGIALTPKWKTSQDYAIVSRFWSPATGQPVIEIAGITVLGTQAAGNFLSNPTLLSSALCFAPKGWEKKNFQFVLHTNAIGQTPERPTVVAVYFW